MIKEISIKQLKTGMYIHSLDCSWIEHPFARNQFVITEPNDIKKIINAGIKTLKIDTAKGRDIETEKQLQQSHATSSPEPEIKQSSEIKSPSTKIQRRQGKEIKNLAEDTIKTIMMDVRMGKQVAMEHVTPVVGDMASLVLDNHNTLLGLSRIRSQDAYTFEHSVNVGVLMMSFAKSKGMPNEVITNVGIGGILHDLGKTLTPLEILNKPAKLTDEEFVIMRGHVVDSRKILEKTPGITPEAMDVAANHHEKFDGSGYPQGLNHKQLSEISMMSAIVDVYDALTADRCYHKGQDPSVVLKRMLSWTGSHFHPQLLQEFIHCVGIYPPGTLVKLSNHHLAVVAENNTNLLLPTVISFLNTKTNETLTPKRIELGNRNTLKVLSSESDKNWNVDPQKYLDMC